MKQIVFLIIFAGIATCMGAHAQQIEYVYDASGNCISQSYQKQAPDNPMLATTDAADVDVRQNIETILSTEENSIRIFPNPNNGQFQIEMTGFDDVLTKGAITIFSARGQAVFKSLSLQPLSTVNINNQPNGTYVLQINIDSKIFTHKLIISK